MSMLERGKRDSCGERCAACDLEKLARVRRRPDPGREHGEVARRLLLVRDPAGSDPHQGLEPIHRTNHVQNLPQRPVSSTDVCELVTQDEIETVIAPALRLDREQHDDRG